MGSSLHHEGSSLAAHGLSSDPRSQWLCLGPSCSVELGSLFPRQGSSLHLLRIARRLLNHWTTRVETARGTFWWFSCYVLFNKAKIPICLLLKLDRLDWIAPYGADWKWKWKSLSRVRPFATPWTIQSMEFSRPEHWSGQPSPSPGDLPDPGIELGPPALQTDSLPVSCQGSPWLIICLDSHPLATPVSD